MTHTHALPKIRTILVGGFLGAGKTTLIAAATERLTSRGRRVGLITNDQAAGLVDTAFLARPGLAVKEVDGGCFCCRFDDLVSAMDRIARSSSPDLLIGEPVGSCTDLSATVLQPIKQLLADRFDLAPFSVVVDATAFRDAIQPGDHRRFPENVLYIYRKQLEEADQIILNKADLLDATELSELEMLVKREFPGIPVFATSASEGTGVDAWLEHVLTATGAGRTITDVDYDIYAEGEAALGWLNSAVRLQGGENTDWPGFCRRFMESMRSRFEQSGAEVAHLKLHLASTSGSLTANLTSNRGATVIRGRIEGAPTEGRLLVNARAHVDPERLRSITEESLASAGQGDIRFTIDELSHFAPARPTPTHRFDAVFAPR